MQADITDRGRGPEIRGTRITVFDVLDCLEAGWDDRRIAAALGLLTDEVEAARLYIDQHSEEVAIEFRKIKERIARGNPPEIQAELAAAHAKLHALRDRLSPATQGNGDAEHRGTVAGSDHRPGSPATIRPSLSALNAPGGSAGACFSAILPCRAAGGAGTIMHHAAWRLAGLRNLLQSSARAV